MKWRRVLAGALVLAGVPVCVLLITLSVTPYRPAASGNVPGGKPTGTNGFTMLDPQGDRDLAGRVVEHTVADGTVQVVLSRKVLGGELPCLGLEGFPGLESRPAETFGLVVLGGELQWNAPGGHAFQPGPVPYIAYVYDLKYGGVTAQSVPPKWTWLRAAFGGPSWPQDYPMYMSPDGQPSLAELDAFFQQRIRRNEKSQHIGMSQKMGEWTVTVAQVYARGDSVSVVYTVTGPRRRFKIDQPVLTVAGQSLRPDYGASGDETLGPSVGEVSFRGLPEALEPQDFAVHFEVLGIHVRPPRHPCEVPGTRPEEYPTPTRIPNDMRPGGIVVTPVPDIQTVGPFAFDLTVRVEPIPTQPPVPTPVPTREGVVPPLPEATGQP